MAFNIDNIVGVNVIVVPPSNQIPGVGNVLIITKVATIANRAVTYLDLESLFLDHPSNTPIGTYGVVYFGQVRTPEKLIVGEWDGVESLGDALIAIKDVESDWFIATHDDTFDEADKVLLSGAIDLDPDLKIAFLHTEDVDAFDALDTTSIVALVEASGASSTGIFWSVLGTNGENRIDAGVGALMATTNLTAVGGAETYSNRILDKVTVNALTNAENKVLENRGVNFYTSIGNNIRSITRNGELVTAAEAKQFIDTFQQIAFMKGALQIRLTEFIVDFTAQNGKIPYDSSGIGLIGNAANEEADKFATSGIVSPGISSTGVVFSTGYILDIPDITQVPPGDRAARKLDNIRLIVLLSGAIHNIEIDLIVN